jgi:hypothetical protein
LIGAKAVQLAQLTRVVLAHLDRSQQRQPQPHTVQQQQQQPYRASLPSLLPWKGRQQREQEQQQLRQLGQKVHLGQTSWLPCTWMMIFGRRRVRRILLMLTHFCGTLTRPGVCLLA